MDVVLDFHNSIEITLSFKAFIQQHVAFNIQQKQKQKAGCNPQIKAAIYRYLLPAHCFLLPAILLYFRFTISSMIFFG